MSLEKEYQIAINEVRALLKKMYQSEDPVDAVIERLEQLTEYKAILLYKNL